MTPVMRTLSENGRTHSPIPVIRFFPVKMSSEDFTNQSRLHPWRMPQPFCSTTEVLEKMYPLLVCNSLTRSKVRFIPKESKTISWYQCGPTVYAESHIGHARTYVGLDIIRRIFQDFLGYNVLLCQNVTDVDDKIIIRSAENGVSFRELAAKFEAEFNEDMLALGVEPPDMVTRVSEYVPLIVEYIETLVQKGVAYESNGSVYFSVVNFESKGHKYGKLMPEQIGNSELLAEGEGKLSANDEKQSASDFVLWKRTKQQINKETGHAYDEPSWESPWGPGRPGWHIECSVMSNFAMQKFGGGTLDIHAGGVDLKFPHHENEIAQSEGYSGCHQWVNYWLHMGHLHIKGRKMSKSLKNFITIREALELNTSRQLRFCFLLHKYNMAMDYSDETMTQAVNIEKIFSEFFHNAKAALRKLSAVTGSTQFVGPREEALLERVETTKSVVREHLMNDFDTPKAVAALVELVRDCNKYLETVGLTGAVTTVSSVVLASAARYITSILRTFGLVEDGCEIGFPLSGSGAAEGGIGGSKEQLLAPYLNILTEFRKEVRLAAMSGDTASVLNLVDALRDEVLPKCGVRMEDKGSGEYADTVWKLEDPETLLKEIGQKVAVRQAKEKQKEEAAKLQLERDERAKIVPSQMFLHQSLLYSLFDAEGVPTHDAAGEVLSKGVLKRLQKEFAKQKETHEKYTAKQQIL